MKFLQFSCTSARFGVISGGTTAKGKLSFCLVLEKLERSESHGSVCLVFRKMQTKVYQT